MKTSKRAKAGIKAGVGEHEVFHTEDENSKKVLKKTRRLESQEKRELK